MGTTATTIAITSAANAQAAAANAAAQEAARKACMAYVRGYEHDRATVSEMREYAGCIERLHPAPLEPGDLMVWKVVVAVLLVGMVVGIVREWQDPRCRSAPAARSRVRRAAAAAGPESGAPPGPAHGGP